MGIREFIKQKVLLPRLKEAEVVVVYDPERRYHELCLGMDDAECRVIDAGESSIEAREQAVEALRLVADRSEKVSAMLVYIPAARAVSEEERQRDPFAVYGACGDVFPSSDGDEYQNLCIRAKPDFGTEIRKVFANNPNPEFDLIDAIGGGGGWPTLKTALGVDSAREIILALLAPTGEQLEKLKANSSWIEEARSIAAQTIGFDLKTKSSNWSAIADELWRYVLFSEFVFDLPERLPESLSDVPKAPREAKPIIEDVCETLRDLDRKRPVYVERAQAVENELLLRESCKEIEDFGVRDTFPFEERSFLSRSVQALEDDDLDVARAVVAGRRHSVWTTVSESQSQWQLVETALELIQACHDVLEELPNHLKSQQDLIDFYVMRIRDVDRLQREFELAEHDLIEGRETVAELIPHARAVYRSLMDAVQEAFVSHLERAGWPASGLLSNADAFEKLVAPHLRESGRKTALFLIDSLRYELAVELEKLLVQDNQVEVRPVCAVFPTVTAVGMASLLPEASGELKLSRSEGSLRVAYGSQTLSSVSDRMAVLRERYGTRFDEMLLKEFVRGKKKVSESAELLVLRSRTIDQNMEMASETALKSVQDSLKTISAAIHRLRKLGFSSAVVLTDHGFVLNSAAEAGDVCTKPPGDWTVVHDRFLVGEGAEDNANFVLPAEKLLVRGDFSKVGGPRALVPYRGGVWYFHGGASLQEAVVPAMTVRIPKAEAAPGQAPSVDVLYRAGATVIRTRFPVVQIKTGTGDLFSATESFPVLMEAHDEKNNVVGEAKPGGAVNPATRIIELSSDTTVQVTLRMDEEFEGPFIVKVLDPKTQAIYGKLTLETDYTV